MKLDCLNEENLLHRRRTVGDLSLCTIPAMWTTARLAIADLTSDDITVAQDLYNQSAFMREWTGQKLNPDYIHHCFTEGDIPPGGRKENFKIQTLRDKSSNALIGLLVVYHGHPRIDCAYITFLFLTKEVQKQGLGQELVRELFTLLKQNGYKEVRANVQLKNWAGLRFWTKLGLQTVTGIYGDLEYSTETYADVELSMAL